MKRKIFSILVTLVLVLGLSLIPAAPVAAAGEVTASLVQGGAGKAEWSNVEWHSGSHSAYLEAGATVDDVGGILLATEPIPIAEFSGVKFWMNELTGSVHGGSYPDALWPYGDPYINIKLDLDGNLATDDHDYLEGVDSNPVAELAWPDYADTWTEMEPVHGFYDMDDSMGSGYDYATPNAQSLEVWKAWLAANHPSAVVIQIQIIFGWWADESNGQTYVDDVTINGLTYNLEADGSVGLTVDIPEITAISVTPTSINFGTLYPGDSSVVTTLTVENIGTVTIDVDARVEPTPTVFDNLLVGTLGVPTTGLIAGLVGGGSSVVDVQLVVPSDYNAKGVETATLIFEATTATP